MIQLLQIFVKTIGEKDLTAVALLNISDSLKPHALSLLLVHSDALLIHTLNHFLVTGLLCLTLVPLLVLYLCDNSSVFFVLHIFFVYHASFLCPDLFLNHLLSKLDQADLQPLLKNLVAFLIFKLYLKTLFLFFPKLVLSIQRLLDKFPFLPLVHTLLALLILLI